MDTLGAVVTGSFTLAGAFGGALIGWILDKKSRREERAANLEEARKQRQAEAARAIADECFRLLSQLTRAKAAMRQNWPMPLVKAAMNLKSNATEERRQLGSWFLKQVQALSDDYRQMFYGRFSFGHSPRSKAVVQRLSAMNVAAMSVGVALSEDEIIAEAEEILKAESH